MQKATSPAKVTNNAYHFPFQQIKLKGCQYCALMIKISLRMVQDFGLSPRACSQVIEEVLSSIGMFTRYPKHGAIRLWSFKSAYSFLVREPQHSPQGKWAIIADESISLGAQKLLVILGVNLDSYQFGQPLTHKDVDVLTIKKASSWKGDQIVEEIKILRDVKKYDISYLVSDDGPNLIRAARLLELPRVSDCGHGFATVLRRSYFKDDDYEAFMKKCTALKRKGYLSGYAHLLPPILRHHSRFVNLSHVAHWAEWVLGLMDDPQIRKKLKPYLKHFKWLEQYRPLITEMTKVFKVVNPVLQVLKKEGISDESVLRCQQMLDEGELPQKILQGLKTYLKKNSAAALGITASKLIGSTDVLESFFGKYKYRAGKRIRADCLRMVGYGKVILPDELPSMFASITNETVITWVQNAFGNETRRKRKLLEA